MTRFLLELTSAEINGLDRERTPLLLPIGSLEQHGPHLPLGTDTLILAALIKGVWAELGETFPLIIAPTWGIGKSVEHLAYPGTLSLRAETMLALLDDICACLSLHGLKRLVILNSHGGNTDLLRAFSYDLRQRYALYVYNIDLWASPFFADFLSEGDIHAGEVETSLMLYLHPQLVQEDLLAASPGDGEADGHDRIGYDLSDGDLGFGWLVTDLSSTGVIGNPTAATAEKGEEIFSFAVQKVCRILRKIAASQG